MAGNFLEVSIKDRFKTQFGLLVTSQQIGAESEIIVAEGAVKAKEFLEDHSPVGNFQGGALKRSWLASLPTPLRDATGQFLPGGGGFEARAHINTKATPHISHKSLVYNKKDIRDEIIDPPWKYALAISEGRRAMAAAGHGQQFMWQRGRPRPVFIKPLAHRPGNHFITIAQEEATEWVRERTRSFASRLSNSTPGSRAVRRSNLGFPGT